MALALRTGDWPDWAVDNPAVRQYLNSSLPASATGDALLEYEGHLRASASSDWADHCIPTLREFDAFLAGGQLLSTTPDDARRFLAHIVSTPSPYFKRSKPRSPATRNRKLAICSGFFRWAMETGRVQSNPFAGIKRLTEAGPDEIVYCTREEREDILRAGGTSGTSIAVWLAFFTGARLSEIARLEWRDVLLSPGRVVIRKSKTGKRRSVPLHERLRDRLNCEKQSPRGHIVPWPEEEERMRYASTLLLREIRERAPHITPDRVRWNAFRHTWATLLAQAGVSLDKISAWMGNSPDICRRHYAEFVPRDERDKDIDRL